MFKHKVYQVTSALNSFVFWSVLMQLALVKRLYHWATNKHCKNFQKSAPESETRLVRNLEYYFNIQGLHLKEHKVRTQDGFIIVLQHVVDAKEASDVANNRQPVLLLHGLLQSSGAYCTSGPNSLAFHLHKSGFDVWLGNNRCGFVPEHVTYKRSDPEMWDWDIHSLAKYDLPALVDTVLHHSTYKKVTLVAHSQGTTQTFLALMHNDNHELGYTDLNSKLLKFVALAPAVYGGELLHTKYFIKFMNMLPQSLFKYVFGITSFMPIMMSMRNLLLATSPALFTFLSYTMFNFLFDWDDSLWNRNYNGTQFMFSPVYISSKLMVWWLSSDGFYSNSWTIFNEASSWIPASTVPIYLFLCGKDKLVNGATLLLHFQTSEKPFVNEGKLSYKMLKEYSHLDVLWAHDAAETVGDEIVSYLQS